MLMKSTLIIIVCFFVGILPFLIRTPITFLTDPPPWPDEAIYVDIVKTLNETGTLATNIYGPAYPGMTKAATFYPPVYFYVLAGWTRLFGYNIISIRMLSLLAMSLVFVLLYTLFLKISKRPWIATLGLLILSTELWFTRTAKIARMESLVFLFGTAAIFLSGHTERSEGSSTKTIRKWLVGILAALAFLTHPMGALTHIVIGLQILFSKRSNLRLASLRSRSGSTIYDLLTLTIPTLIGTILWLGSMIPVWNIFRAQWTVQYFRKALQSPYIVFLFQTNQAFLLIALVVLITLVAALWHKHSRLAGVMLSIAILWAMWGKEMWYITYIMPFVAFAVMTLMKEEKRRGIGLILAGALIIANIHMLQDTNSPLALPTNHNPYYFYSSAIGEKVSNDATVLVSAIPDPSFGLMDLGHTRPYQFIHDHVTTPAIYQAHLDTIDYVVANLFSDPVLPAYIKANMESQTVVDAGGYKVLVVKLVPRAARKHI